MKKVFKWWLPKGSMEALKRAKTVMDVTSVLFEESASGNKKWFITEERPVERVTVTLEMED